MGKKSKTSLLGATIILLLATTLQTSIAKKHPTPQKKQSKEPIKRPFIWPKKQTSLQSSKTMPIQKPFKWPKTKLPKKSIPEPIKRPFVWPNTTIQQNQ